MESCYFGAQTLRTKIQFAFHELPPEAHSSLRDSMLDHLRQINEHTNTVIVTQVIFKKKLSDEIQIQNEIQIELTFFVTSLSCAWH